jgi:hypothetical protein
MNKEDKAVKIKMSLLISAMFCLCLLGACAGGGGMAEKAASAPDGQEAHDAESTTYSTYNAMDGDSLIAGSRDAVDGLTNSVAAVLPPGSGVLVASFVDAEELDETTSLGRLLAAQFSTGLTSQAFLVKESRLRANLALRPGQGEFVLSREAAALANQAFDVAAILYGFYTVDQDAVYVSARVALAEDGSVIASEDYALLNRRAVSRMLGNDHDALFERYVRQPVSSSGMGAEQGLVERDLTEEPPGSPEPAFRIFPPTRLNQ